MITIKEQDISSPTRRNDELYEFFIEAKKLDFKSKKEQQKFFEVKNELTFLLRSKYQLDEAHMAIIELVHEYYNEYSGFPKNNFSKSHVALLSYAATLICSCFIEGRDKKRPLEFLLEEVKKNTTYTQIKNIRDKRFSHQDDPHEVHRDYLKWRFEKTENGYFTPIKPSYTYENLHSLHRSQLDEWLIFICLVIQKINEREKLITQEINPLIKKIELIENSLEKEN